MTTATKLHRHTRAFMERGFGEDFGSVTVSSRPTSWFPSGATACTVGERIFVNPSAYRHDGGLDRYVLAHELAHVVQKRHGGRLKKALEPASRRQVEAEADAAATCVLNGGEFACTIADAPEAPRFFGPLGHYYTAYFVMLAAGVKDEVAHRLAYYTQIPDLVSELDAKWLAIHTASADSWDRSIAKMMGATITQYLLFKRHYQFSEEEFKGKLEQQLKLREFSLKLTDLDKRGIAMMTAQQYPTLSQIQIGLHCLSNDTCDRELAKRTTLLGEAHWGKLEFGLALHAYADAFAHRREDGSNTMYGPGLGHAKDSLSGNSPDNIVLNKKREELYLKYATSLFKIIKELKRDQDPKQVQDDGWLEVQLAKILQLIRADCGTESNGLAFRLIASSELNNALHPYEPQDDAMWWKRYEGSSDRANCGVPICEADIREAFQSAKDWTTRKP